MTRIDLPYLWLSSRRGKPAAYYRRGGNAVRIKAADGTPLLPGAPGFLDAYAALHNAASATVQQNTPAPRSLAALIAEYRASPEWADLAPATREDYGRVLAALEERFGTRSVADMPRRAVFVVRDAFAGTPEHPTPRRANKVVSVLRLLLSWAVDHGWRRDNPALRPGRLRTGPGYATWTTAHLATFLASDAGEPLKRAAVLGFYTGMRLSDCLTLPRSARAGGWIEVVPAKTARSTRARVAIPEHVELTRWLDAAPPTASLTLLTRADGRPWKADHFKHRFVAAVRAAGLPEGLSFHGLRKGFTAALAEGGATDAQIESLVPHSGNMTRHYRAAADQKVLARTAIGKLK